MRNLLLGFLAIILTVLFTQCANVGRPSGGEMDVLPPVMKDSKPLPGALGYSKQKVRILFDELVVLQDLNNNFLVSPPTEKKPKVTAYGKELAVEFEEPLQENTTYTIYFGDAVADNNEGNILPNFSFSFSTGEYLDTMRLQGFVYDAKTLEPDAGVIVGIYDILHDSVFTQSVPMRIAKTNAEGWFSVNNVRPGAYIVRALKEVDNDFRFNQATEKIAFTDSIFSTQQETIVLLDSVFRDSVGEDREVFHLFERMQERDTVVYFPDSIMLLTFVEDRYVQYLNKSDRADEKIITFEFETAIQEMPRIHLLGDSIRQDWNVREIDEDSLKLVYWVTDTALYRSDTVAVVFDYQVTDTLEQLMWKRDTLYMRYKHKQKSARQQRREAKEEEKEGHKIESLKIATNASSAMPYFDDLMMQSSQPLERYDMQGIRLYEEVNDSTFKALKFVWKELPNRAFTMEYRWDDEKRYRLIIDSATFESVYGLVNDSIGLSFAIAGEDKYSTIIMNMSNLKGEAIIQLLDKSQVVLQSQKITPDDETVYFDYLKPGAYYLSLFYDKNGNGKWDAGSYEEKRQAEEVHFFHKVIEAKAYYEMEEDWDVEARSIFEEKPASLIKKK